MYFQWWGTMRAVLWPAPWMTPFGPGDLFMATLKSHFGNIYLSFLCYHYLWNESSLSVPSVSSLLSGVTDSTPIQEASSICTPKTFAASSLDCKATDLSNCTAHLHPQTSENDFRRSNLPHHFTVHQSEHEKTLPVQWARLQLPLWPTPGPWVQNLRCCWFLLAWPIFGSTAESVDDQRAVAPLLWRQA